MIMEMVAMKLLKSMFIQRFSAFDVIIIGGLMTSDLVWWATAICLALWTIASIVAERTLDLRNKNGNTPWDDL